MPEKVAKCLPLKHFGCEAGAGEDLCFRALLVGPHDTGRGFPSKIQYQEITESLN